MFQELQSDSCTPPPTPSPTPAPTPAPVYTDNCSGKGKGGKGGGKMMKCAMGMKSPKEPKTPKVDGKMKEKKTMDKGKKYKLRN
jgi:hypothetical protein